MDGLLENVTGITGVSAEKLAQWILLLSMVLPYVIALVQQPAWSSAVRSRVSMGVCALAAAGVLAAEGALTVSNWLTSAVGIFALTATFYRHFAKQNGALTLEGASTDSLLRACTPTGTPLPGPDAIGLPGGLAPPSQSLDPGRAPGPDPAPQNPPADSEISEPSADELVARYNAQTVKLPARR